MRKKQKKVFAIVAISLAVLATFFLFDGASYLKDWEFGSGDEAFITAPEVHRTAGSGDSSGAVNQGTGQAGLLAASECSPSSGFNVCYQSEESYTYYDATARAFAKVQLNTDFVGTKKGDYWVGPVKLPVKLTGDAFYLYENMPSWDSIWNDLGNCNENGCNPPSKPKKTLSSSESIVLATPGETYTGCPAVVAIDHDRDDAPSGYWAWAYATVGWGWIGSSCMNLRSVECYENADCPSSQVCDKSGSWQSWKCVNDPCAGVSCPNKCSGGTYSYGGTCQAGQCQYQTKVCSFQCSVDGCVDLPCSETSECQDYYQSCDYACVGSRCVESTATVMTCPNSEETVGEYPICTADDCSSDSMALIIGLGAAGGIGLGAFIAYKAGVFGKKRKKKRR